MIEVSCHEGRSAERLARGEGDVEIPRQNESAVALAEVDGEGVLADDGNSDVDLSVAIEIAELEAGACRSVYKP
jgi:hypothetical protein